MDNDCDLSNTSWDLTNSFCWLNGDKYRGMYFMEYERDMNGT